MNTFIGIRGSGKSSILELIAYALGKKPQEDSKYKQDLINHILGNNGTVSLFIVDQYGREYQVLRKYGDSSKILSKNGIDTPPDPSDLLQMKYFGQKDLSQSPNHAKELLEQMVHVQNNQSIAFERNANALSKVVKQLLDVREAPDNIKKCQERISSLKHKISVYTEKGIDEKLKKQTDMEEDRTKLSSIQQKIMNLHTSFAQVSAFALSYQNFLSGHTSVYNQDLFSRAGIILSRIDDELAKIRINMEIIEEQSGQFQTLRDELNGKLDGLENEFKAIRAELQTDTLNPNEYINMSAETTQKKNELEAWKAKENERASLDAEWRRLIHERHKIFTASESYYYEKVEEINQSQDQLRIEYSPRSDENQFLEKVNFLFQGTKIFKDSYLDIFKQLANHYRNTDCDFAEMIVAMIEDWIIADGKVLRSILTPRQYSHLENNLERDYSDLLRLWISEKVSINYHNKPLENHSNGQRASALILFVLTQQGNDMLLIDQPEDDLDNQVIYEEVIQNLREKKSHMQFIFATHNANIPVLGDAERVFTTEFQNDSGISIRHGNIDCKFTQNDIVRIMEGGREAFNKRTKIYDSWKDEAL